MRENNVSAKADLKENQQVNFNRMMRENSKSYKVSSIIEKISECKNAGLPTKTVEPAPGSNANFECYLRHVVTCFQK